MNGETVLVTGGSGFIAGRCILHLLEAGYQVRATLRSLHRADEVRAMLKAGGVEPGERLSCFPADLNSDEGWLKAVAGCTYVLHVASPVGTTRPKNENELILPALEGTLRVLRAARGAGVRRVVLTSSYAAISAGHDEPGKVFTEEDWSKLDGPNVHAYYKSKTIAELAAWDFITCEGGGLELATVNPVYVFGPVLALDYAPSIQIIKRLMDGSVPGIINLLLNVVDVRDVADLHLRAMCYPEARGERFLAVTGEHISIFEMAALIRSKMPQHAARIPTRELPDWLVRFIAHFDPEVARVAPDLSRFSEASNEKACRMLGWSPRTREEAILATAESLVRLGLVGQRN
jgi:nucleoside-diphosphate-sugar epimerase